MISNPSNDHRFPVALSRMSLKSTLIETGTSTGEDIVNGNDFADPSTSVEEVPRFHVLGEHFPEVDHPVPSKSTEVGVGCGSSFVTRREKTVLAPVSILPSIVKDAGTGVENGGEKYMTSKSYFYNRFFLFHLHQSVHKRGHLNSEPNYQTQPQFLVKSIL